MVYRNIHGDLSSIVYPLPVLILIHVVHVCMCMYILKMYF